MIVVRQCRYGILPTGYSHYQCPQIPRRGCEYTRAIQLLSHIFRRFVALGTIIWYVSVTTRTIGNARHSVGISRYSSIHQFLRWLVDASSRISRSMQVSLPF